MADDVEPGKAALLELVRQLDPAVQVVIPTRSLPSIDAVLRAAGLQLSPSNRIAEYLRHKSAYDAR